MWDTHFIDWTPFLSPNQQPNKAVKNDNVPDYGQHTAHHTIMMSRNTNCCMGYLALRLKRCVLLHHCTLNKSSNVTDNACQNLNSIKQHNNSNKKFSKGIHTTVTTAEKKTVCKKIIKFRNNWYLISSMVVGHSLLLARLPGTHWVTICAIRRLALTVSDVCLRLVCFQSTSTSSTLEVLHIMPYVNLRLTYYQGLCYSDRSRDQLGCHGRHFVLSRSGSI